MQLFKVTINGDALQIQNSDGKTVKELLDNKEVYLIADSNRKTIWLYRGIEAGILLQFMGTRVQKEMKLQVRGFFSAEDVSKLPIDSSTYHEIMDSHVTTGNIEEVHHKENSDDIVHFESEDDQELYGHYETKEHNKQKLDKEELSKGELTATQKKIKLEIESRARETCVHVGVSAKDVIPKIKDLENPPNFHRNMTLIGNSVYREEKIITSFLMEQNEFNGLKKIGMLPNGFFFLDDVSSRIIIRKGRVQALDFMVRDDKFLGLDKIIAPVLMNERISKEGNINQMMSSFREKEEDNKGN